MFQWRTTYGNLVKKPLPPSGFTPVEPKRPRNWCNQAGANDFQSLIRILWTCCLSPASLPVSQWTPAVEGSPLHLVCLPLGQISTVKLHNPLLTRSVSHSIFSTRTTDLFLPGMCSDWESNWRPLWFTGRCSIQWAITPKQTSRFFKNLNSPFWWEDIHRNGTI